MAAPQLPYTDSLTHPPVELTRPVTVPKGISTYGFTSPALFHLAAFPAAGMEKLGLVVQKLRGARIAPIRVLRRFLGVGRFPRWAECVRKPLERRATSRRIFANMSQSRRLLAVSCTVMSSELPSEEILRLQTALERSEQDARRFLDGAVHDLRSAHRGISIALEILAETPLPQLDSNARSAFEGLCAAVARMNSVLSGVSRYASSLGACQSSLKAVPAGTALRMALASLEQEVHEAGVTVTHGALPTVLGDLEWLTEIFRILIDNALKYRSGASPKIDIQAIQDSRRWLFSVRDNGMGIDRQYWDALFVPFRRLHGNEIPGVGLGLPICKRILEAHRGTIWLESEVGRGSTLFFTLPAAEHDDGA